MACYELALGKGCIYSFDPVGSYERETYRAGGSAASMLQPLLDNQVLSQQEGVYKNLCESCIRSATRTSKV